MSVAGPTVSQTITTTTPTTAPHPRRSRLAILPTSSSGPSLADLRLSHILNGETCPPLSFPDFASFIAHKELSSENLLFVVWYKSYVARWENNVAPQIKVRIPIPSTRMRDRYQPFRYLDDARHQTEVERPRLDRNHNTGVTSSVPSESTSVIFSDPFTIAVDVTEHPSELLSANHVGQTKNDDGHGSESADASLSKSFLTNPTDIGEALPRPQQQQQQHHHHHQPSHSKPSQASRAPSHPDRQQPRNTSIQPPLPPADTEFLLAKDQPMRDEVLRVFATFLKKGGSRELSVADDLREYTKVCLERSCSPESFLPIYENIYASLEEQSLPHFLSYASTNINKPKQTFWFIVGTVDILIGLAIFLIPTLLLSRHHLGFRAIRLPSLIFAAFGAMQFYSAMRGFCNQVWGRRHRQLRPWELDEPDDEANFGIETDTSMLVSANDTAQRRSPRTDSIRSLVFTPVTDIDVDAALASSEIHPLSDLSGSISSPTAIAPWEDSSTFHSPASEHVNEMTEKNRSTSWNRVRRSTIQVPSAGVVFPIDESHSLDQGNVDESHLESDNISTLDKSGKSRGLPLRSSSSQPDFSTLFVRFGRGSSRSPVEDESKFETTNSPIDPTTMVAPLSAKARPSVHCKQQKQQPKIKVFGPETVIEDPRVLAYFESVVRDILVVGTTTGILFIVLSLAVPTFGA